MSNYKLVIPRDLFNHAKFLKCLGALVIATDYQRKIPGLELTFDGEGFAINQNPDDASLYCPSIRLFFNGEEVHLFHPYNSLENYPLMGRFRGEEYYLFDERGKFMPNFM